LTAACETIEFPKTESRLEFSSSFTVTRSNVDLATQFYSPKAEALGKVLATDLPAMLLLPIFSYKIKQ